jgi:membrane-associated phospholipid phosphatase
LRGAWIRFWLLGLAVGACFVGAWFGAPALVGAAGYGSLATRFDAWVPYCPGLGPIYLSGYLLPLWPLAVVRDPVTLTPGLWGLLALVAVGFACFVLLPVAVPTPSWHLQPDAPWSLRLVSWFGAVRGNCFPSLHVAFAAYVAAGMYSAGHWSRHAIALLAVAIAFSTVALRLHFVVDVPAGAALGWAASRIFAARPLARWAGR